MSIYEITKTATDLMELRRMREELDAEISALEDQIKAHMGDQEQIVAGAFKITWRSITSSRFDSARFKLWYLRSDYHNLPIIDGCIQKPGREFSATPMQTKGMSAHTEISGAYGLTDGEWIRSINFESDEIKIKDRFTFKKESAILHYILKEAPTVTENRLIFSDGTTACFDGITSISIETIDITGKNPPDGIIGDAANRKTDIPSVLIPRIFERQWKQSSLYRVTVIPCENEVTLTVKGI